MIRHFKKPSSFFCQIFLLFTLLLSTQHTHGETRTKIVFLGDSITAGYDLRKDEAYPALIKNLAAADGHHIDIINAGLSGDTTSGGLRRIHILVRKPVDLIVIALGGNDGLRGIPPKASQANLESIIDVIQQKQPEARIIIAGMQMPDNMGKDYSTAFKKIFPSVAKAKKIHHLEFLLEGVAAEKSLNLPDGIHPNTKGQEVIAKHVYKALTPLLR